MSKLAVWLETLEKLPTEELALVRRLSFMVYKERTRELIAQRRAASSSVVKTPLLSDCGSKAGCGEKPSENFVAKGK